ncbi:MAG: prolyl oligopeptidase family serine peptidase [Muribaculaceae bacterium]|nr:prolyl oligopeptidase family serine peptidase [Muribaculaceae bacterium]
MRKPRFLVYLTVLSGLFGSLAVANNSGKIIISNYKATKEVNIPLPARPDISVIKDAGFDHASLLGARKAADYFHKVFSPDWTTILPDTSGNIYLSPASRKEAKLHTLTTELRPERFVKGKLIAKSTSPAEIFLNGESKLKKTTSDSIPKNFEASVSFNPEETVQLEIHILALPEDKSAPTFSLEFMPDAGFENVTIKTGSGIDRRFTINTTTLGGRLEDTFISADGKYIILNFSETYGEKDSRNWSTLRRTDSDLTVSPYIPNGAKWLPSSTALYYGEKNGQGNDLYRMDIPSMKSTLIAADIPTKPTEIFWTPDEKSFIYYDESEGEKDTGVMRRIKNPDDRIPGNRYRGYLKKYDLSTGTSVQLTYGGPTTVLNDISADSHKILYIATRETPEKFPFYANSLIQLDLNSLRTDTLVANSGGLTGACFSPDGEKVLIWGSPNDFNAIGKNDGNHEWANDYDYQLFLMDVKTNDIKPLTRDFDPCIKGRPIWNRSDGKIYFTALEGFTVPIYSLNPYTEKFEKLPIEVDVVKNFSAPSSQSRYLSYTGMGYDYVGRGHILNLKNRKNSFLADPMGEGMASLSLGKTEDWSFIASDGTMIDGTLTLPPDFDSSRKYPLIVYYYGGTAPSQKGMNNPYTPHLFAARNYVVYVLNPSGTPGYGQEFSSRHVNAWGERTADDIIEGVKELCRTHPFINEKKIGCLGGSYGGFMTQLLQTKTDLFAAAVSHAGISNITSYWGEGYWGYTYNSVAAAKSYPWSNPDLFTKHGSLFNADKIHTPLLLLHGTDDTNVPIGESIQLFNALKILDRDVELITVEKQNHIITDFNKRKLWHATIMAWFAKYLQDDPRWWNELYK